MICNVFFVSKERLGYGSAIKVSRKERNGPGREGVTEGTVDGSPVGILLGMFDG